MEEVINRIKEIRKEKGISHEAMAFDLGISQVAYSKIEKNETKLTLERLYKIADILESKVSNLLGLEIQKVYQQEFKDINIALLSRHIAAGRFQARTGIFIR